MFETSKTAQVISTTYCNGKAKRDGLNMGPGEGGGTVIYGLYRHVPKKGMVFKQFILA